MFECVIIFLLAVVCVYFLFHFINKGMNKEIGIEEVDIFFIPADKVINSFKTSIPVVGKILRTTLW